MEFLSEIVSFLAGLVSGFALKVVIDRRKSSTTIQAANRAGGDIAGRDIHKR